MKSVNERIIPAAREKIARQTWTRLLGRWKQLNLPPVEVVSTHQGWRSLNLTVEEGLKQLATLCLTENHIKGKAPYHQVPKPRAPIQCLLDAAWAHRVLCFFALWAAVLRLNDDPHHLLRSLGL